MSGEFLTEVKQSVLLQFLMGLDYFFDVLPRLLRLQSPVQGPGRVHRSSGRFRSLLWGLKVRRSRFFLPNFAGL